MEFLNPAALYGLLGLPLLLIPYLIRRKPRRFLFSSLVLFSSLSPSTTRRPWGRMRLPPSFFVQLLLLLLLILALAEPFFDVRPTRIAIVMDNSASMQTMENGLPRFALAKEQSRQLLDTLGPTGTVDLYTTVPGLEKVSPSLAPSEALRIIEGLEPLDLADVSRDYNAMLNQLARDQHYERIYLITDHPARGQSGTLRVVTVGQPKGNLALTSFQINRSSLTNDRFQARVEVTNYTAQQETLKVLLEATGTVLASRSVTLAPGKSAPVEFDGFSSHPFYQAEIENRDSLQLDNRRFAVAPAHADLRILGVSPRPQTLASLRRIPGIHLDLIAPTAYGKTERGGYDLEIFHFAAPVSLPRNAALFVLPPDASVLVDSGNAVSRVTISSWREGHALTRYVNFSLLRPTFARTLKPQSAGEVIIDSAAGPLALTVERRGTRHLVLGFDPFPYLGRENLPMSIFTLNVLDWFSTGRGGRERGTGEALGIGASQKGDFIITPRGKKMTLQPGTSDFLATVYQGIYQLNRRGHNEPIAVNLGDSAESDLRDSTPIELSGSDRTSNSAAVAFSYWPHLVLGALVLLLLEWFIDPRAAYFGHFGQAKRAERIQ